MRVYADRFYVLARTPGIGGFQRWGQKDLSIAYGPRAARCRSEIVGELDYVTTGSSAGVRLGDGHLADYQPRAALTDALAWLRSNPHAEVYPLSGVRLFTR